MFVVENEEDIIKLKEILENELATLQFSWSKPPIFMKNN
jgi:hypothetical protein